MSHQAFEETKKHIGNFISLPTIVVHKAAFDTTAEALKHSEAGNHSEAARYHNASKRYHNELADTLKRNLDPTIKGIGKMYAAAAEAHKQAFIAHRDAKSQ